MDAATAQKDTDETPLWSFVSLADYQAPSAPGVNRARQRWAHIKRFFSEPAEADAEYKRAADLQTLPDSALDLLAGQPDWRAAATALDAAIQTQALEAGQILFIIGQPHSGHGDILAQWSGISGAKLIDPPSDKQILAGDLHWLDYWPDTDNLWLLPRLEDCFLRHTQGLELIRTLLEAARAGRLGRGIIGCDSWAWAYLQHIWPMPHARTLTLGAFDGDRLARLMREDVTDRPMPTFVHARTGKPVLAPRDLSEAVSPTMHQIAQRTHGNPGIAWREWRNRLRTEPEPESKGEQDTPDEPTIWIADPWEPPALPKDSEEPAVLILHTLLIHGGLSQALLSKLLPLPAHRCSNLLYRLDDLGLVNQAHAQWQVAPLAYPAVRTLLQQRGYLVDHF